jgi:hypothetical protein
MITVKAMLDVGKKLMDKGLGTYLVRSMARGQ